MAHENPDKAIETLLRIIEEAIPTKAVYANQVEMECTQKDAFEGFDMNDIKSLAETLYETKSTPAFLQNKPGTKSRTLSRLTISRN